MGTVANGSARLAQAGQGTVQRLLARHKEGMPARDQMRIAYLHCTIVVSFVLFAATHLHLSTILSSDTNAWPACFRCFSSASKAFFGSFTNVIALAATHREAHARTTTLHRPGASCESKDGTLFLSRTAWAAVRSHVGFIDTWPIVPHVVEAWALTFRHLICRAPRSWWQRLFSSPAEPD